MEHREDPQMANLKSVLKDTIDQFLEGGPQAAPTVKRALRAHRKKQQMLLVILAIMLVGAAGLCAYLLLTKPDHWREMSTLFGIGGQGGVLWALRGVWKDWSRTDLLLILIEDASEAQITAIIDKLTKSL